jgi:hypothetical protein
VPSISRSSASLNCTIGSAVTEQAGHANCIGIVVFQPLLAAERIADRRLQSAASWSTSSRASLQPSPPKIATVFASSIISQADSGQRRKGATWAYTES